MLETLTTLGRIRSHYTGETRDFLRVLLNSTSAAEASLSVDTLRETVPEKVLVQALNLREVLKAIPTSPFTMRIDEPTLADAAGLTRSMALMSKELPDGITVSLTTAGNLVLDVIVSADGEKHFWNPIPITLDYVNGDVLDLVIRSDYLLDWVIELTRYTGVVWNPRFYLSLEDWLLESAADAYEDICGLF